MTTQPHISGFKQALSGWGQTPVEECAVFRPEQMGEVRDICKHASRSMIARGAGMSYGDASLNPEGVLMFERNTRFITFDTTQGLLTCEAGVKLKDILDLVIPHGWFLPVIPGTKNATIGGAFACNVHGKNAYAKGEFAEHVRSISLRLANGELVECSSESDKDLFWASAGGMGMTGMIEAVTIQLMPIVSAKLSVSTRRVENLQAMLEAFHAYKHQAHYMIGWIDHTAAASNLGRGVFEHAVHIKTEDGSLAKYKASSKICDVPFNTPSWLLNRFSMALYNRMRFRKVAKEVKIHEADFDGFFHPLDGIGHWNRLYGARGFLQYQFILPENANTLENIREVLESIHKAGLFSFLAVIKYHRAHKGVMGFSMPGFSVALDFPNTPKVHWLLDTLDEAVAEKGGRVYLAKDARMKKPWVEKMYQNELPKWKMLIKRFDPNNKLQSSMSRRLGFKE